MDGSFVDWADANVHVLTHSLHYGLAAFEGLRCYKGKSGSAIFKLQEHVDRLFESAHIGMMTIPYEKKQVAEAIVETVRINKLDACYIRPLVYIGYGAMGVYPGDNPIKLAIAAWKWGSYLGDDALANGMRACVSSFTRHHVNVSMLCESDAHSRPEAWNHIQNALRNAGFQRELGDPQSGGR